MGYPILRQILVASPSMTVSPSVKPPSMHLTAPSDVISTASILEALALAAILGTKELTP